MARPVGKKEIAEVPEAAAAMDKEWQKLHDQKVWDVENVREWDDVAYEARCNGIEVQFGYVFGICVEKGSELDADDPNRKFKGRVVFQGNNVKDENYDWALFAELGSSPCTMQAGS